MSSGRDILVLHASGGELRLVQTRVIRNTVELSNACAFMTAEHSEDTSALRDESTLDSLAEYVTRQGWTGRDLICVIGGSSVACHYYDMPPLKGDALRQAVLLKLDQQLHFDVGDAVVVIRTLTPHGSDNTKQIRVSATAVQKDLADAAVNAASRVGLNMKTISAAPAAITAVAQSKAGADDGLQAFLHVDERISTLIVLDGQSPCLTSELPIGMADLTKALMRPIVSGDDVIQLDEARATALRNDIGIPAADQEIESLGVTGEKLLPLLEPILQQFTKQFTQWLTFVSTTVGKGIVRSIRIVGPGAMISGLPETISSRLSINGCTADWLKGSAVLTDVSEGLAIDTFVTAVGTVQHWQELPDLTPTEYRRRCVVRRVRKTVTICGAITTAAVITFALMADRLGNQLFPQISAQQEQLAGVQQVVGENTKWAMQQEAVARLQEQFEEFARSTPSWVGLFKEVSVLLPREVQTSEFVVRSHENGIRLVLNGTVYPSEDGPGFDEAVEQSLLLLQRSCFFKRVQLLTANREASSETPGAAGTLEIELDLVFPHPRA